MRFWKLLAVFIFPIFVFAACSLAIGEIGTPADDDDDNDVIDDDDDDDFSPELVSSIGGTYELQFDIISNGCPIDESGMEGGQVVIEFDGNTIKFWTDPDSYVEAELQGETLVIDGQRFPNPEFSHETFDCALYQEMSGMLEFDDDSIDGEAEIRMVYSGDECNEMWEDIDSNGGNDEMPPASGCTITFDISGDKTSDDTDPSVISGGSECSCGDDGCCGQDCTDDPDCPATCDCWSDGCCNNNCSDDPDCSNGCDCSDDGCCDTSCASDPDCGVTTCGCGADNCCDDTCGYDPDCGTPCEIICGSLNNCGLVDDWNMCINDCQANNDNSTEFWDTYYCFTGMDCANIESCIPLTAEDTFGTWRVSDYAVYYDSCAGYFRPDVNDYRIFTDTYEGSEYHLNAANQTFWYFAMDNIEVHNDNKVVFNYSDTGYDCQLFLNIYGNFSMTHGYAEGQVDYSFTWGGNYCQDYFYDTYAPRPPFDPGEYGCSASYYEYMSQDYPGVYNYYMLEANFNIH